MSGSVEGAWQEPSVLDPGLVRRTWRSAEALHGLIYFAPEAHQRYAALGIDPRSGYFASRAAAMGSVGSGAVAGAFFNFNPELVSRALPAVWERATPAAVLAARLDAADAALRRVLGDAVDSEEMREAAGLARTAAESVGERPEGRALFAAHAALPWPDRPHLVLWHAQTVLREFRGDGHAAALLVAGLTGLEALVLHVASGEVPRRFLQRSRGWSDEQWDEAAGRLRGRGLIEGDEPALTDAGRSQRTWIEAATDRLAAPAYEVLGAERCTRFVELAQPMSRAVVESGSLNVAAASPRDVPKPT
ncbi:SCO6745 family protein [Actinoplanes sp. CA-252034]|uniref:SCO6745 family protein n=1 Tax=Actinoplanes sp. CA-252034 TaxID=3239906 RepID=UPI003D981C12